MKEAQNGQSGSNILSKNVVKHCIRCSGRTRSSRSWSIQHLLTCLTEMAVPSPHHFFHYHIDPWNSSWRLWISAHDTPRTHSHIGQLLCLSTFDDEFKIHFLSISPGARMMKNPVFYECFLKLKKRHDKSLNALGPYVEN